MSSYSNFNEDVGEENKGASSANGETGAASGLVDLPKEICGMMSVSRQILEQFIPSPVQRRCAAHGTVDFSTMVGKGNQDVAAFAKPFIMSMGIIVWE